MFEPKPGEGGIKSVWYISFKDDIIPGNSTTEEFLLKCKEIVDRSPDHFLQYHFDWSIKKEVFEISAYIRDVAKKRDVILKVP